MTAKFFAKTEGSKDTEEAMAAGDDGYVCEDIDSKVNMGLV